MPTLFEMQLIRARDLSMLRSVIERLESLVHLGPREQELLVTTLKEVHSSISSAPDTVS